MRIGPRHPRLGAAGFKLARALFEPFYRHRAIHRAASDFAKSDLEDPNWITSAYAYFDVTPPAPPTQEMASSQIIDEPAGAQLPAVSAQEHDKEMSHILHQYQLGKGEAHQMDNKYWNNPFYGKESLKL